MTPEVDRNDLETRLKDMEAENELLLLQLHQVQEELERYYLRNQELENNQAAGAGSATMIGKGWVDDELPAVLAENQRLQALVRVQQSVYRQQTENALNVRLGNLLIDAADSPTSLPAAVAKLLVTWWRSARQAPPRSLGGKDFGKVIAAHDQGGFPAVEQLMDGLSISAAMQANAWTALARHLMNSDPNQAAEAAERAHALDPKPFRLKWLAFRLHETGRLVDAEAMLDALPSGIAFSGSEQAQADRLRNDAQTLRRSIAFAQCKSAERNSLVNAEIERLMVSRNEQAEMVRYFCMLLEKSKKENDSSTQLLHESKQKLFVADQDKERLALDNERLKQLLAESQTYISSYEDRVTELDGILRRLSNDLKIMNNKFDAKKNEVNEYKVTMSTLLERIARKEEQSAILERRLEVAETAVKKTEEAWHIQADSLKREIQTLSAQRLALLDQNESLASSVGIYERDIDSLHQEIQALEQTRSVMEKQLEDSLRMFQKQTDALNLLELELAEAQEERSALIESNAKAAEALRDLRATNNRLESSLTDLQEKKKVIEEDCNVVASAAREHVRFIAALEEERDRLTRENDEKERLYLEMKKALMLTEENFLRMTRERTTLVQRNDDLSVRLLEAEKLAAWRLNEKSKLQEKLKEYEREGEKLAHERKLIEDEVSRVERQLFMLKKEVLGSSAGEFEI